MTALQGLTKAPFASDDRVAYLLLSVSSGMSQIETKMAELVNRVVAEGAYCCRLASVKALAEKPASVLVTMQCQRHKTYNFEVASRVKGQLSEEQRDSSLMKQIANAIANNPESPDS